MVLGRGMEALQQLQLLCDGSGLQSELVGRHRNRPRDRERQSLYHLFSSSFISHTCPSWQLVLARPAIKGPKTQGDHKYVMSPDKFLEVHVGTELLCPYCGHKICHTEPYLLFQAFNFFRTRTLWHKQIKKWQWWRHGEFLPPPPKKRISSRPSPKGGSNPRVGITGVKISQVPRTLPLTLCVAITEDPGTWL